jgi:GT2 family glycosyltransferase
MKPAEVRFAEQRTSPGGLSIPSPGERFTAADLSVVLPTRQRWNILARTLDALRRQSVQGFETIVVVDDDQSPVPDLAVERTLIQAHAGPAAARNRGVGASTRSLVLFLGDDMIPTDQLVQRHLECHSLNPEVEVAVLGHVDWHPELRSGRLLRWLTWSDAQFDYSLLARQGADDDAGFGRFYSCNVSLKRELFTAAQGFDPDFYFDYEDLDLGWRLHQLGLRLVYERRAVAQHLHAYEWHSLERRYESRARAEQLMMAKHDWFEPWFRNKLSDAAQHRRVLPAWPFLVDLVPTRLTRLRRHAERMADRWYCQRLAPVFMRSWDAEAARRGFRASHDRS